MKWYRKLHWQIILGMILGLIYGIAAAQFQWTGFATNWVVPFGDIFMNLLKLIAVPLVLTSLVAGVASLSDFKKLSRMGSKTIGLYIATTAVAVTIGLLVVNVLQPGASSQTQPRPSSRHNSKPTPPTRPKATAPKPPANAARCSRWWTWCRTTFSARHRATETCCNSSSFHCSSAFRWCK